MDEADRAERQEQLARDMALAVRKKVIHPTGYCANCDEPTGGVCCCHECGEDFEKRMAADKRNGL